VVGVIYGQVSASEFPVDTKVVLLDSFIMFHSNETIWSLRSGLALNIGAEGFILLKYSAVFGHD
jgi:hypothetical protein